MTSNFHFNILSTVQKFPSFTNSYDAKARKITYDALSRASSTTSPDYNLTRYLYNKEGQLRFSQNALQETSDKFSYINYDRAGRVVESGEYDPAISASGNPLFFQSYEDYYGNNDGCPNCFPTPSGYTNVHSILDNTDGVEDARCTDISYMAYDTPGASFPGSLSTNYPSISFHGEVMENNTNIRFRVNNAFRTQKNVSLGWSFLSRQCQSFF